MHPKIINKESIHRRVAQWQIKNDIIVFTNGCFDILHVGHIHTLREAKKLGTKLIVGLNSDASVERLKGIERPIIQESNRAELLASLEFVDAVVLFEEDTPLDLIKLINPSVLVKGGDWEAQQIVGSDHVLKNNGSVVSIPFMEGKSTTSIIHKIQRL